MKIRLIPSLLAGLLLASTAAPAADLIAEARALAAANDPAGAVARYREAAALPGADAKARARALYGVADLFLGPLDHLDDALAAYDAIAAIEDLPASERLAARNRKTAALMRFRTKERVLQMREVWAGIGRDTSLTPAQRIKGWISAANNAAESSVYANLDEARQALDQALTTEGLAEAERAEVLAQYIHYWLKAKDLPAAADCARRILASSGATPTQRIEAAYQLAGVQLMQGDEAAADATVRGTLTFPGLSDGEKGRAYYNIGQISARMYRHAAAREAFAEAARLDPALKLKAETAMADAWMAEGATDQALTLYREAGRVADAAGVLHAQGDSDAALALLRAAINDETRPDRDRWPAMTRFLDICLAAGRFEEARGILAAYQTLAGDTAVRGRPLMSLLQLAMTRTVYPFAAEAAETLGANGGLAREERFLAGIYGVNALAGMGEVVTATARADHLAQDERLAPLHRFTFALIQGILAAPDQASGIRATVGAVETAFAREALDPAARLEALLRAGRTAMIARRFTAARAVGEIHTSRFVPEPTKTYTVGFMPQAPASIDGFLASDLVRDPPRRARLDRKFGGNLELVVATDAATGDRGDIRLDAGAVGDTETGFFAVCDADGIHLFFEALDDKTPEVEAGLLRGGSFEGYLAAGERVPHTCFLVNLQSGKVTLWNAAYATDQHTPITAESAGFRSEFRHTDRAHLLYLFFDWAFFHDKLPGTDDAWLFEVGRWARGGRVTWNGLKTVHGRSSFGHWRFDLSDADRRAIKRKLIYKAYARYLAEKNPRTGGLVDFYADKDYSDPAFHAAEVAPLIERLDAFGKRVSAAMPATEVDTLFAEAVPSWMNIRYRLTDLRRAYLERKLTDVK
jgi:tetratricopeptide (TPR) repeat protein